MICEELLKTLRVISPEEQLLLDGSTAIQRGIYMEAGSDVIDAKKLLDSGRLITIRPHTRFAHFPEHSHNYVEVVYMCCGSTTHIANGKTIELQQGELLFFGQGARQEILPAGENDIAVNFIILPQFFDKALEMLDEEETPLRKFIVDSLRGNNANCLYFRVADVLPIQNLIENLIWTLLRGAAPNRRSICQTTMGLLFIQLLNYTDRLVSDSSEERCLNHSFFGLFILDGLNDLHAFLNSFPVFIIQSLCFFHQSCNQSGQLVHICELLGCSYVTTARHTDLAITQITMSDTNIHCSLFVNSHLNTNTNPSSSHGIEISNEKSSIINLLF